METTASPKPAQTLANDIQNNAIVENAKHAVEDVRTSAEDMVARSSNALSQGAARAREAVSHTTDQAAQYVQDQPLKSLLMAAAAGVAIALLAAALSNRSSHH